MRIIILLVGLVLLAIVACGGETAPPPTPAPTPFTDVSFKVAAGREYRVTLSMTTGSRLEYQFRSDLDIDVRLLDPMGAKLVGWGRVESFSTQSTTATMTGVYALVFDNSFSLMTSKSVDLTYRVVPPGGR